MPVCALLIGILPPEDPANVKHCSSAPPVRRKELGVLGSVRLGPALLECIFILVALLLIGGQRFAPVDLKTGVPSISVQLSDEMGAEATRYYAEYFGLDRGPAADLSCEAAGWSLSLASDSDK